MKKFPIIKLMIFDYLIQNGKITGYAFRKYCEEMGIPVSNGTIYPHLQDLLREGIIEYQTDGKKKLYHFTKKGEDIVLERQEKGFVHENLKKYFFKFIYHLQNTNWNTTKDLERMEYDLDEMKRFLQDEKNKILGSQKQRESWIRSE